MVQQRDYSTELRQILRSLRGKCGRYEAKKRYLVFTDVRPWPLPAFPSLAEARAYCLGVDNGLESAKLSRHFDPHIAHIDYNPQGRSQQTRPNNEIFGEIYIVNAAPGSYEAYRLDGPLLEDVSIQPGDTEGLYDG